MAAYEVFLTRGAERDLTELHRYVASTDSPERADRLLDRVMEAAARLASFPERGHVPDELQILGIREYRQLLVGQYRLIYRLMDARVYIYVIADTRRDMQSLLQRRLLDG